MNLEQQNDQWQKALSEKLELLKSCQSQKNVSSCFQCDLLLDCQTRDSYVNAVYESMNKGSGGGFEF